MSRHNPSSGFQPSDFFALRTPLLPWEAAEAWSQGLQAPQAAGNPERLDHALSADRAALRSRLRAFLAMPAVRDALFLASPELESSLPCWESAPDSERGAKVERALVRYFVRMTGRATPFGLFAGCSTGRMGAVTRLAVAGQSQYRRLTRLDMDYLFALAESLARSPGVQEQLTFRPNSSLYRAAGRLRYAEALVQGRHRSYHLVALEPDDYLDAVLTEAAEGRTAQQLAVALQTMDGDIALDECRAYIDELIAHQVLLPDLTPVVTGPEPLSRLIADLRAIPAAAGAAAVLEQAAGALEAIDRSGPGAGPEQYRALAAGLAPLPVPVALPRLFQVDLVKPAPGATLGPEVTAELTRAADLLHRIARPPMAEALTRFRKEFTDRYGTRSVPLTEALDPESGIGFHQGEMRGARAEPLLRGVSLPDVPAESAAWGRREQWLLRRLAAALETGSHTITLEPADIERMEPRDRMPLPDAFALFASVAAGSGEACAGGDFQLLVGGLAGPSGARLLGRFCHADPDLAGQIGHHLRAEEALHPDAIFAEVVHLPEGRAGNILSRPALRDFVIPFLGRADAPADRQIPISDLLVSVTGSRVLLHSKRLGRRVIPRLTTAHVYSHGQMAIYHFLGALQEQDVATRLRWDWGPLEGAPFLPRVISGRLVLSRARWRVGADELKALGGARGGARFAGVQAWRADRRLPRHIALVDGDNELPVDLDNVLSIDAFVDLVRNRERVTLTELFPAPDQFCVQGPEGRFAHELVVPFVRREAGRQEPAVARGAGIAPVRRTFAPGSEWLYAKLFTGTATADQVLCDLIGPVTASALRSGAADRWFFLRYGESGWHIRLRLHGRPERLYGEVLPALHAAAEPLLENGQLWQLELDTYEREVERYGGPAGILLAEEAFHADSEAALALVEQFRGDARAGARWRLALCGMDRLLDDLGLDLPDRLALMRHLRDSFTAEFRLNGAYRAQLGDRFRAERAGLQELLAPLPPAHPLAPGLAALQQRSLRLAPVVERLRSEERAGRLAGTLPNLAASLVHMHANRVLRAAQRAQEMFLYDFLARLYDARLARGEGTR